MKVTYSSNNSGGDWWLSDKDWIRLEAAGWDVEWGGWYRCHQPDYPYMQDEIPSGRTDCGMGKECPGHKKANNAQEAESFRWLGALAKNASKDFETVAEALHEFEHITDQDVCNEGCNCCGAPHSFSWEGDATADGYCSGEGCLTYLYQNVPTSFREAVKQLNKGK